MSVRTYSAYDLFGDGTAPRVVLFTDHQSSLAEANVALAAREQRIARYEVALHNAIIELEARGLFTAAGKARAALAATKGEIK